MDILPHENTGQVFLVFFILSFVGGLLAAMVLGYLWMQLKQLGNFFRTKQQHIYANNHSEVFPCSVLLGNSLQNDAIALWNMGFCTRKVYLYSA